MAKNKKALMFIAPLFDEKEFIYPYYRLQEAGYDVDVAGEKAEEYKGKSGLAFEANVTYADAKAEDYETLVVPGGYAPDKMRTSQDALEIVKAFHETKKPIAMICHAGWVAASADVIKGVKLTSTKAIKDDLVNAGAEWEDSEVVVDQGFITSRSPADLPAFMKALLKELEG